MNDEYDYIDEQYYDNYNTDPYEVDEELEYVISSLHDRDYYNPLKDF